MHDTVTLPDGTSVDIVFPVEIEKYPDLVAAIEYRKAVQQYSAEDAAFRFNALSDELRLESFGAEENRVDISTCREELKSAMILYRLAGRGGMVLDERRLVLVRRR
jgi:hypothetical protein